MSSEPLCSWPRALAVLLCWPTQIRVNPKAGCIVMNERCKWVLVKYSSMWFLPWIERPLSQNLCNRTTQVGPFSKLTCPRCTTAKHNFWYVIEYNIQYNKIKNYFCADRMICCQYVFTRTLKSSHIIYWLCLVSFISNFAAWKRFNWAAKHKKQNMWSLKNS